MAAHTRRPEHVPLLPIRIFLASPGDLFPVRSAVKRVVEELNRDPRYEDKFKFILYAYEDRVPPVIAEEPQRAVNQYMLDPDAPDIFLCLFWKRLGTPTVDLLDEETGRSYPSGTVYELLTAYRARRRGKTPAILLYRCTAPAIDVTMQTPEQELALDHFFARFRSGGDLIGLIDAEFSDASTDARDLVQQLQDDLTRVIEVELRENLREELRRLLSSRSASVVLLPAGLPPGYVERTEALEELRRLVLGSQRQVGVVALQGQGGLGKSVLAKALCLRDQAIRGAFPDGILWADMGQYPDILATQRAWIRALGDEPARATTVREGIEVLQALLRDRTMLLVLDDVWQEDVLQAFLVGGERCRLLITTRDAETVPGTQLFKLDVMRRLESVQLLQQVAPSLDSQTAESIAERLGDLPLALHLVGSQLRLKISWATIQSQLDQHDPNPVDPIGKRLGRIYGVVATSVEVLPSDLSSCFKELAIFAADEALNTTAVARLWGATHGWPQSRTEAELGMLRGHSLLQPDDTIHGLVRDYLLAQYFDHPDRLRTLHRQFAATLGTPEEWPLLPLQDTYVWTWLVSHLVAAGEFDAAATLVSDGRYLATKIFIHGTEAAAHDVELCIRRSTNRLVDQQLSNVDVADGETDTEKGLRLLAVALRQGAQVLDRDTSQLENQLFGRLGDQLMLHDVPNPPVGLRLMWPSLTPVTTTSQVVPQRHTSSVTSCAFSPNGQLLVASDENGLVRLLEVNSGREIRRLTGQNAAVLGCAFSPDGKLLATAGEDEVTRLWEVANGHQMRVLPNHSAIVTACAFSPVGRLLATSGSDGVIRLWDALSGRELPMHFNHEGRVSSCTFSPDGKLLATSGSAWAVRLWATSTGQEVAVLEGHESFVLGCAFSPDGTLIATVSVDETVRLWNISTLADQQSKSLAHRNSELLPKISALYILAGHEGHVNSCAFSADGSILATAGGDRTVRLWERGTWHELAHVTVDEAVSVCTPHPHEPLFGAGDTLGFVHLLRVV